MKSSNPYILSRFRWGILIRVGLLLVSIPAIGYGLIAHWEHFHELSAALLIALVLFQAWELARYAERTNQKLSLFLQAIQHEDFQIGFSENLAAQGKTFEEVHAAFDRVLDMFRDTRAEREAVLQFLDTLVAQVATGLIAVDSAGKVTLANPAALALLGMDREGFTRLQQLRGPFPELFQQMQKISLGRSTIVKLSDELSLLLRASEVKLQGETIRIMALQNIHAELQAQELAAWRKLTSVLRHEIMNSVTPIASYTSTLVDTVREDFQANAEGFQVSAETYEDLLEGLHTIEERSLGLVSFVEAYRSYTRLPQPQKAVVKVQELCNQALALMQAELQERAISWELEVDPEELQVEADSSQISMVLINLLQNAMDALAQTSQPHIQLRAFKGPGSKVCIQITDNGPGISQEAREHIFVPFFTTKQTGSGIGLSLSRQIMQLQGGSLSLEHSQAGETVFLLKF